MRFKYLAGMGGALLLGSCQGDSPAECVLLESDFEQFAGWITPVPAFLNEERAHSGNYSYRLLQGEKNGSAYHTTLDHCRKVPHYLRLSAWVYLPSGRIRSTKLVVQTVCHGRRPDTQYSLEVDEVVKRYQQWEPVQKYIRLPADLQPSDELRVYLQHAEADGENLWLDDLKLVAG